MIKQWLAYKMVSRAESTSSDVGVLEKRQVPSKPANFNDSFYFGARDFSGNSAVFRVGLRSREEAELWCDLFVAGLGKLSAPRPAAAAEDSGEDDPRFVRLGNLSFACREPGRIWDLAYAGPMLLDGGEVPVDLNLRFTENSPLVDFKRHADSKSLAGYLAAQKWSREWFGKLRDLSQVHYEQSGNLVGTVKIGDEMRPLALRAVRDHSFGTRNWRAMKRHAWIMALLEDGSSVNVSLVSYDFLPYMHSGYVTKEGRIAAVTAAPDFSDLPPGQALRGADFLVRFRTGWAGAGEEWSELRCTVDDVFDYSMGGAYEFREGLATFEYEGMKGVGICELGYGA